MKIFFGFSKTLWIPLAAGLLLFSPQISYASAVVQQIQGEVLVNKHGAEAWNAVTTDTVLENGDSLKTREGSCSLTYSDQAVFAIQHNTSITVEEKEASQDITLTIGKILGKVNKPAVTKPFQVVTPAAVAAVRGTEVDFEYTDQGELAVDLHNGKIHVFNDQAEFSTDLDGGKKIKIKYDKEAGTIHILNECGSDGAVKFNILGAEYAENPCDEKTVDLSTASNAPGTPNTPHDDKGENPDEGREPASPTS